jgi:hypothetical protein
MVKIPPPANVPPICRLPPVSAPVEKLTDPSAPVTRAAPPRPFTAMSSDPDKPNPAELPERVPPLFVKSTEVSANAANGRAIASRAIKSMRFITVFPPNQGIFLWSTGALNELLRRKTCCIHIAKPVKLVNH